MKKEIDRFPEDHYQLMARYNQWMNNKIYDICNGIPEEERTRDMGAFFKSIHGTLNHILYGDIAWLERLRDRRQTQRPLPDELSSDFHSLRKEREKTDIEIIEWADMLDSSTLNSYYSYTSNVDNKTRTLPVWMLATHMFNHQTHHRGQVTTLLKQLGYEPGITDIPWMPVLDVKKNK